MFKRKQDVDKHVASVLNRKKDEKERHAQGYQIARLYLDIKEYETAKRYLAGFLRVRENSPQGHQMMGEINEALGKRDMAVDNYKRALDLGGFGSSNRQLVLKICELYCDLGTDDQRMKYWLQKCEELFPQSDIVYRMKTQILSSTSNGSGSNMAEMEKLLVDEMTNRPKDLDPRIKLLHLYLDTGRVEEAYDTAVDTDLTTAFYDSLPWYECVLAVFEKYSQGHPECASDTDYLLMNMHVLRNVTFLSLPTKAITASVLLMKKFDEAVKEGENATIQEDSWQALVKEMKGQVLYLAGLVIIKRAMMGSIQWKDANQLSGACFLACTSVPPLDAQAAWFVKPRKEFIKFFTWWYQQGHDRLSQAGHMIQQLSQNDAVDWSRTVHAQVMTGPGHRRVFEAVYSPGRSTQEHADNSFLHGTDWMVSKSQEPLSPRQLLDIDRVAYQVHLGKLSHLVWLCLQRYSPNKDQQPNYHFNLMENIQFSVKNLETAGSENLCQLDILTFLLASVRCAASSISDNVFSYDDHSGRPTLLPVSLSRPFCSQEQEEWWDTAFKFCSNTVKDNFSRLRRVLIRGVEVVRLKGTHGVSIPMQCHLARSLDAKVRSLKQSEFGCRCSAAELAALEARALFYWERANDALAKFKKNQHPPAVKNRMFKEAGDGDLPPRMVDQLLSDADFATALALMDKHRHQDALERFARHPSPWAAFYSAQIMRRQAEEFQDAGKVDAFKSLMRKSRDCLYTTMDRLNGDKSHELNFLVSKEMDDLEIEIQGFDYDENESSSARDSFYTPTKTPSLHNAASVQRGNNASIHFTHSTPRRPLSAANLTSQSETSVDVVGLTPSASHTSQINGTSPLSPRRPTPLKPSPERLESQIKSLGYSQTTLFRTVLDRNEELVLMHSRIMEEHGSHNGQLQEALTENKRLMEDLKVMLVENRDMLKGIKAEIAGLKSNAMAPPSPIPPTGPQLIVAPPHLSQAARGAYPGFHPPPQPTPGHPPYPGYLLNPPMPPHRAAATGGPVPPPPHAAPARASQVGKFKLGGVPGMVGGDEEEEEEDVEDLEHGEDFSAMYQEYFVGPDQDYTQYYTPDSHVQEWSLRSSGIDPNTGLSMSPAIQQAPLTASRMPMPQPGFFASALRGQAIQYAQQQQQQPQTPSSASVASPQPVMSAVAAAAAAGVPSLSNPGPGFFSTPASGPVEAMSNVAPPAVQGNIPIFSAMSSIGSGGSGGSSTASGAVTSGAGGQVTGLREALSSRQVVHPSHPCATSATPEDLEASLGFKVLFHIKAMLPSKNIKGGITILLGPNASRTTVVMMSDTEEMLFQHDANGLVLLPAAPGHPGITWTASRIGTAPLVPPIRETVTIITLPESMGNLLREALQKASMLTPDSTGTSAPAPTAPSVFGSAAVPSPSPGGAAKTTLGGFSFSSTPVLTPHADREKATPHADREKATPHKGATSPVKADSPVKPFAGVSLSVPKFTSPISSAATSAGGNQTHSSPTKAPDERQDEYEPNVDFKPVIPLPELVEKKTGEENETVVFVDRCRLFRYDTQTNQWKERGVGEMKILCDNKEHRYRVVMRRDQIFKLCANHFISGSMKLSPLASSDKTWCYSAIDYSDEEMKMEQLAVKFKNPEKAKRFKDAFEDCVAKTKKEAGDSGEPVASKAKTHAKSPTKPGMDAVDSATGSIPAPSSKQPFSFFTQTTSSSKSVTTPPSPSTTTTTPTPTPSSSTASVPLSELFKPKPGNWECPMCMCQNQAVHMKCPACGKTKPGSEPSGGGGSSQPASTSFGTAPGGGFVFGSSSASPSSVFGGTAPSSTTTPASTAGKTTAATSGTGVPLSELFKPKAGAWECEACLCQNQAEHLKCPACGQRQPGVKAEDLPQSAAGGTGGFRFGSGEGFNFGSPAGQNTGTAPSGGFSFGVPPLTTDTSTPSATTGSTAEVKSTGFSFRAPAASTATAPTSTAQPAPGGFRVPSAAAFTFGSTQPFSPSAAPATAPTPTPTPKPATATTTPTALFKPQPAQATAAEKQAAGGSLLASLLTSDESNAKPEETSSGFSFIMTPGHKSAANEAAKASASTNNSSSASAGFNFNFHKSPPPPPASGTAQASAGMSTPNTTGKTGASSSRGPKSPEVDEQGLYVTKDGEDSHIHFEPVIQLPDKIETKTGEEEEEAVFESRARMYRFVSGEWKEKGTGVMKILEHKQTKKARVLMRRDQVLKICCNHTITPDLDLQPMAKMEGKAWLWYALDYSDEESKMEQLAVRFKKPETAEEFKNVFNRCKNNAVSSTTPRKEKPQACADSDDDVIFVKEEKSPALFKVEPVSPVPTGTTSTTTTDAEDVVFVKEEQASPEQKALAAKYKLPVNFYLYELRKPCRGCLGCTDGEGLPPHAKGPTTTTPSQASAAQSRSYADAAKSPTNPTTPPPPTTTATTAAAKSIFGTNASSSTPPLSTKIPDKSPGTPVGKSVFGAGAGLDASSSSSPSIFGQGSGSPSAIAGPSPSVFGGGPSPSVFGGGAGSGTKDPHQKDFSSLFKGGNTTPTTSTSSFVFGAGSATPDFSSLASTKTEASFLKKADAGGPFKFQGAGQKLFGSGSPGGSGGNGDVAPNQDVHFEPIIPLPELVQVKTGEEDWTKVFSHRAKLYKFDSESKQWKERGIGDIKIMSFNKECAFRILQRREQVLKVSCNHMITKDMALNPMSTSQSSWCWVANDLAEEEPSVEQFAVKFKNKDIAAKFKTAFEECQQKLIEKEEQAGREDGDDKEGMEDGDLGGDRMTKTSCVSLDQQEQEVVEDMTRTTTVTPLGGGGGGNVYHSKALDVGGQDRMTKTSCVSLDQQEQEVVEDMTRTTTVTPLGGGGGNVYHSKALDVSGQDRMTKTSCVSLDQQEQEVVEDMTRTTTVTPLGGGGGNVYHSKALDVGGQDRMTKTSCVSLDQQEQEVVEDMTRTTTVTPLGGGGGNVYHSKALDKMTKTSCGLPDKTGTSKPKTHSQKASCPNLTVFNDDDKLSGTRPSFPLESSTFPHQNPLGVSASAQEATQEQEAGEEGGVEEEEVEEDDGDDDDDDYEDVDEDEEDDEQTIFEKRATLQCHTNGKWKKLGTGQLMVMYDDDLNGNSIKFFKDDGTKLCSHMICREHSVALDKKNKSCEWKPLDYATDEAIRQHFKVDFSSLPAAEEFALLFMEGNRLAVDSDLSEKLPRDMDVPEVYSRGEGHKD